VGLKKRASTLAPRKPAIDGIFLGFALKKAYFAPQVYVAGTAFALD
jgi:hypothetical protein